MPDLEVRIEELEPMPVASVRVVSENPELDAWEKMRSWAEAKGLLGNTVEHPVYGFNNPSPSPGQKEYGYEFWIKVPPDTVTEGEIKIKSFAGGLYAVTTHRGFPNPEVWMSLWERVKSSPYRLRETNELEKPHDPLAAPEEMVFDLFLPIETSS
jgi:DNA gyrase inhibitor GyrI